MKNGEKKGFDVNDVSAYVGEIEKWRDDLRDMATGALQMQGSIEESERDNLQRALDSLRSVDELVKIIGELPYTHVQAHALGHLWGAIGAAFIIGSRGVENPVTQKFLKDKMGAQARSGKHTKEINEVVARHCAARAALKNAKRAGNKLGTAKLILEGVNSDLAKLGIKPQSEEAVRARIRSLTGALKLAD
jgi:hypothetical protein